MFWLNFFTVVVCHCTRGTICILQPNLHLPTRPDTSPVTNVQRASCLQVIAGLTGEKKSFL